jgi:hypothetical protein
MRTIGSNYFPDKMSRNSAPEAMDIVGTYKAPLHGHSIAPEGAQICAAFSLAYRAAEGGYF